MRKHVKYHQGKPSKFRFLRRRLPNETQWTQYVEPQSAKECLDYDILPFYKFMERNPQFDRSTVGQFVYGHSKYALDLVFEDDLGERWFNEERMKKYLCKYKEKYMTKEYLEKCKKSLELRKKKKLTVV